MRWLKRRVLLKEVPFGVKNVEINTEPLFMPPNVKFWQKSGILAENALQWGCSPTKDP